MYSITATIGRNITAAHPVRAHQPLTLTEWEDFTNDVEDALTGPVRSARPLLLIVERHYGKGEWNGVEEESRKVTILAEFDDAGSADMVEELRTIRTGLALLANQYGQDAIALTIGQSELISSDSPRSF